MLIARTLEERFSEQYGRDVWAMPAWLSQEGSYVCSFPLLEELGFGLVQYQDGFFFFTVPELWTRRLSRLRGRYMNHLAVILLSSHSPDAFLTFFCDIDEC